MKTKTSVRIVQYIIAGIAAFFAVIPFVIVILTSFKSAEQIYDRSQFFPSYITLENYEKAIIGGNFFNYFKNSAVVALITTSICIILAIMAAYGFSRFKLVGAKSMRLGILFTRMFPGILLSVPYYSIMRTLHLTDTLAGLVLVYCSFSLPFCIWNLRAFFAAIPWDIEDAAFIDGASRLQSFVRVILPMARPGILATSLFAFIHSWEEFMFANLFITSASKKTVQLGVYSFIGEYSTDWGGLMAAAVISLIPVIIFFAVVQKNLVTGITAGAVKG